MRPRLGWLRARRVYTEITGPDAREIVVRRDRGGRAGAGARGRLWRGRARGAGAARIAGRGRRGRPVGAHGRARRARVASTPVSATCSSFRSRTRPSTSPSPPGFCSTRAISTVALGELGRRAAAGRTRSSLRPTTSTTWPEMFDLAGSTVPSELSRSEARTARRSSDATSYASRRTTRSGTVTFRDAERSGRIFARRAGSQTAPIDVPRALSRRPLVARAGGRSVFVPRRASANDPRQPS